MTGTSLLVIDAFTDRPFGGNPAAVVLVEGDPDAGWMQSVAAETNLPATAAPGRGVEVRDDRVVLTGTAVTVLTGVLTPALQPGGP